MLTSCSVLRVRWRVRVELSFSVYLLLLLLYRRVLGCYSVSQMGKKKNEKKNNCALSLMLIVAGAADVAVE